MGEMLSKFQNQIYWTKMNYWNRPGAGLPSLKDVKMKEMGEMLPKFQKQKQIGRKIQKKKTQKTDFKNGKIEGHE